jgi:NAD(P)H dehydrogenase (quinone)
MSIESNASAQPSVLLVTAHPDQESLTWQITREVAAGVGDAASVRVLDLTVEGFNPTFTAEDLAAYRGGDLPDEIKRHQAMVDAADVTVAIFPVYWWSMPALLKGWVDRVLTNKWAYDFDDEWNLQGLLGRRGLGLQFLALASNDEDSYERHGYLASIRASIDHGIVEYCGVTPSKSTIWYGSEDETGDTQREMVVKAVQFGRDVAAEAAERRALRLVTSA